MGSVWRAEHLTLSAEVAVKIIDPAVAQQDMGLSRFMREARALAALHSPYIVQVIDFGSQGDIVYLVMELLEGKTLGQRLKTQGKLSPTETLRILTDVCKAMSHAHDRGIIHRDLKPDNIFLCDESREHVTKVLDFGIAKPRGLESVGDADTSAGAFLGTPSYMSPEQCRGEPSDPRSDLWAIGAITYECLSGEKLFGGGVLGIVMRICNGELQLPADAGSLPPGFVPWLRKALALEPGQRFQSAAELSAALAPVLGGAPRPVRGVDSAETLSDTALPVHELPPPSASSSTLAHGSVEKVAHRSEGRKRASLLGFFAGALVVSLAAFVLLRQRVSLHGSEPTPPAPMAAASPELPAQTPGAVTEPHDRARRVVLSGAAPASGADAGVSTRPTEQAKPGAHDAKLGPTSEPPARPPRRYAPQRTPLEMEELRKRR
jgi:eukaryotic-like serine/threonine-protein kinase